jgi:transcriptional accessory protein Tex/SPT6
MRSQERSEGSRSRGRPKRAEVDKDRITSLKVGDVVEGTITGFAPFGAFADIGVGKDGLIHVSELAEGRVEKPEDAVKVGEQFNFKILEIDPEGTRISLSLRRAMRTQRMQGLEPGQVLDGTVSGLAPFGAFVDIGVGRDGLVHISALSSSRVGKVEDVVKVGDKVTVKVLEVDQQSKRISLTMRLEDTEPTGSYEDETPSQVIPRTGPGAAPRFAAAAAAAREGRSGSDRNDRGRDRRRTSAQPAVPETYSTEEVAEEFVGDATLEDLLSKYGSPTNSRRDRKKDRVDGEEEEDTEATDRRQRDAIRRTLQQVGRDE